MRYRDYCNITFEQIELMKRTISFNGTRLRGWKYKSFQIHQNCICRDESNVVTLQELLYLGLMTANDTQQYSLTEDGIQLLSWVTEVEIYEQKGMIENAKSCCVNGTFDR